MCVPLKLERAVACAPQTKKGVLQPLLDNNIIITITMHIKLQSMKIEQVKQ